jgi:beta-phosphoglucomutase
MAGAWLSIVNGFAGVKEYGGQLIFNPIVPKKWDGYRFKVTFQGRLMDVNVSQKTVTYTLLEGEPLAIYHRNESIAIQPGKEIKVSLEPKLEAVIFDLDGVITDTAEFHYLAWKKLADEIGLPFDRQMNEKLKGIGRLESLEIILKKSDKTYTEEEKIALTTRKNDYYKKFIQQTTPQDILPGIASLLKELKDNGIKVALASASKNAFTVVDRLQIGEYFDTIVDASKIAKGKPDPEIFMTAAERLGIPYRHCIGIEDSEAGITAIKAANMLAVGVGSKKAVEEADWIVKDTTALTLERLSSILFTKNLNEKVTL